MKKLTALIALLILSSASACFGGSAPEPSQEDDRGHPVLQLGDNKIEVEHGRPTLRGRKPEAMIQPGLVWRMGANKPTTLSTQASLRFGEKVIPAGKYILQAKVIEAQTWRLLIQTEAESTVAEVPFTLQKLDKEVETLTITLEKKDKGGRLILQWGTLSLVADFQPASMTASAEDGGKWTELIAFHDVMSATFHPVKESLGALHDRFHEIAGLCNDAKKQSL